MSIWSSWCKQEYSERWDRLAEKLIKNKTMTKIYVLIDDGPYPTFFLTSKKADRAAAVQLAVDNDKLNHWKQSIKNYQAAQKEIQTLVETYSPASLVKRDKKSSTE